MDIGSTRRLNTFYNFPGDCSHDINCMQLSHSRPLFLFPGVGNSIRDCRNHTDSHSPSIRRRHDNFKGDSHFFR